MQYPQCYLDAQHRALEIHRSSLSMATNQMIDCCNDHLRTKNEFKARQKIVEYLNQTTHSLPMIFHLHTSIQSPTWVDSEGRGRVNEDSSIVIFVGPHRRLLGRGIGQAEDGSVGVTEILTSRLWILSTFLGRTDYLRKALKQQPCITNVRTGIEDIGKRDQTSKD